MSKFNFVVGCDTLVTALKKASRVAFDGYRLVVNGSKKNKDGKSVLSIFACDGNAQVTAAVYVTADGNNGNVVVGPEFANVIFTMAELKKDITLDVEDNCVKVSCDGARTVIPVKEDIKSLAPEKNDNTICMRISTEKLKLAVAKGGFRPFTDDCRGLKNVIAFKPVLKDAGNLKLRCFTTDNNTIACCDVEVDSVTSTADREVIYSLSCDKLISFVQLMDEEITDVFLNPAQVVFHNGNDFFIFRALDNKYPDALEHVIDDEAGKVVCRVKLGKAALNTAISLAQLCGKKDLPIVLSQKGEKFVVEDSQGKASMSLEAEIEGEFETFYCSPDLFKAVVDKLCDKEVTLGFISSVNPVFVSGEDNGAIAVALPINPRTINREKKEKQDSKESK